ncbi:hypothetical protein [Phaeobacter gallaeciensis]|uniref:Uncharacterized protein n=1 Tax=Phaeobacter gallaeciensis TaxID=60890 RepID=A0AAD0ED79_9RHOB|nr:hypothetical protein [Phaeobacter gallaeciensis]AHD09996.1 hypothetical protein Gal_02249 [Phaeobacter gallaeciensis DSM 26640]ATE93260.1 hypothetical protein PhaeoP11_02240 [Phaeobacter gallaeciensis]ATE96919.1 hypothetical protein PhaeoP73_01607 [Phaeobacter gallaeciensis]ATF01924.1 hypothetical protein PhaeoP75_02289 [Phaeobacter gallaeciensis]ATF06304.1 hypothetical protein PhaeoP63_02238 [Phaeobacter gallaeciensis]
MKPFSEWTAEEMGWKTAMVDECRETFGILAARQLSEKLGFPHPPARIAEKTEGEKTADAVLIADLAIQLRRAEIAANNESRTLTEAYADFRRMNGLDSIETGSADYEAMMASTKGEYTAKMKAKEKVYYSRRKLRSAIDRHLSALSEFGEVCATVAQTTKSGGPFPPKGGAA